MANSPSHRLLELDILRGLAAAAVVLFHYTSQFDELYGHAASMSLRFPHGHYGVHLFFVISGFVILMTLQRSKFAADFLVSRFSRLFPAYWAAILVTFTVVSLFPLPGYNVRLRHLLVNLSMCQHWLGVPSVDGVYWTLAVELKFYVLMFALYLTGLLRRIEWVAVAWLGVVLANLALKQLGGPTVPGPVRAALIMNYAHLFIAGTMFYRLKTDGNAWHRHLIVAICLGMQLLTSGWLPGMIILGVFSVFYLLVWDRLSWIVCKPLVFLGTISYSVYLLHQNIGYVILHGLRDITGSPIVLLGVPCLATVALATALTFGIERPASELIRQAYKRRRSEGRPLSTVPAPHLVSAAFPEDPRPVAAGSNKSQGGTP